MATATQLRRLRKKFGLGEFHRKRAKPRGSKRNRRLRGARTKKSIRDGKARGRKTRLHCSSAPGTRRPPPGAGGCGNIALNQFYGGISFRDSMSGRSVFQGLSTLPPSRSAIGMGTSSSSSSSSH